jgi:prolyl 4-hydroxylase
MDAMAAQTAGDPRGAWSDLYPPVREWVLECISRGIGDDQILPTMVQRARVHESVAAAALREARQASARTSPAATAFARPDIDTGANRIVTPDREVEVLLSLKAPRIVLLGGVLSEEECDALIRHANDRLAASYVVSKSGEPVEFEYRSSRSACLALGETELHARIEARLAALAGWPADSAEGLQVIRYGPGQQYREHYDWFDMEMPGRAKIMESGGQRLSTFILYLNDVEEGGATLFSSLAMQVRPKKGHALFFSNVDLEGMPDRMTLHAGLPVIRGEKYIASKWLRERPFKR